MSLMRDLLTIAIVVIAAVAVLHGPPSSEAQTAAPSDAKTAPTDATAASTDTKTGEQLFATTCGFCHQGGGRVAGRGPKLAGTERPDAYLLERIRMGKQGAMPAYGGAFSDAQIRAIIAYIRSLKDEPQ
jgi:mono/diheme cytochrome c family protein